MCARSGTCVCAGGTRSSHGHALRNQHQRQSHAEVQNERQSAANTAAFREPEILARPPYLSLTHTLRDCPPFPPRSSPSHPFARAYPISLPLFQFPLSLSLRAFATLVLPAPLPFFLLFLFHSSYTLAPPASYLLLFQRFRV